MKTSDSDLDRALKELVDDVKLDKGVLDRVWVQVESATRVRPVSAAQIRHRRISRATLIAACVVALTAGLLIIPVVTRTGIDAAAARELTQSADRLAATAETSSPGAGSAEPPYTYIESHSWDLTQTTTGTEEYAVLVESRLETWAPRNWEDQWLDRRMTTGNVKFISGDRIAAERDGALLGKQETEPDRQGPCREYFTNLCEVQGSWAAPTKEWISTLPATPEGMLASLKADAEGTKEPIENTMFDLATMALRTQLLPLQSEVVLYRALALIPGVHIRDGGVDLDGRVGTGYSVTQQGIHKELIIDPSTGAYLGERIFNGPGNGDENMLSYTSVYVKGVDQIGIS